MKTSTWLILIAALALVALFFAWKGCNKNKDKFNDAKKNDKINETPPELWKDKQGRNHATVDQMSGDKDEMIRTLGATVDSLTKALRIKPKQIQSVTAISTVTETRTEVPVFTRTDSAGITYKYLNDSTKWLQIKGYVYDDSAILEKRVYDSLLATAYWTRKWFGGRKTWKVDAYSLNPDAVVVGLKGFQVGSEPPKRFGLGPAITYGFDGKEWRTTVGIALQYSIIKF